MISARNVRESLYVTGFPRPASSANLSISIRMSSAHTRSDRGALCQTPGKLGLPRPPGIEDQSAAKQYNKPAPPTLTRFSWVQPGVPCEEFHEEPGVENE
jgi:hypothetical protein